MNTIAIKLFTLTAVLQMSLCPQDKERLRFSRDIAVTLSTSKYDPSSLGYIQRGNTGFLHYFNTADTTIDLLNLASGATEKIPLSKMDSLHPATMNFFYCYLNPDSIFCLFKKSKTICLIDESGEVKCAWRVKQELPGGISNYALAAYWTMPMKYHSGKLYLMAIRTDIVINNLPDIRKYFETPQSLTLDISGEEAGIVSLTGDWPGLYRSDRVYQDVHAQRCVNKNGEMLFAFAVDDQVYLYSGKQTQTANAKSSSFVMPPAFPLDSAYNFNYIDKYLIESCRYRSIIYDPYRDLYYRIAEKGIPYESPDGMTVRQQDDKPFSILVLDKDLNLLREQPFDPAEYLVHYIIPIPEGLLVSKRIRKKHEKNELLFSLFDLSE
ncbi:MAG: DUF4221 family protein [Bacteroidota bacterium]